MKNLQKSYDNLMRCYDGIHNEFAGIDDSVVMKFLGEFDSPELRQQVKKYGDGHILHSIPINVDDLVNTDAVVLIAVTSPLLSDKSDFNPFTPLHTIPYWRDGKLLETRIHSTTNSLEYRLHFMSWQQNFAFHGVDDSYARRNRQLLLTRNFNLLSLFEQYKVASIEFVKQCKHWLGDNGKSMIVITHYSRRTFQEPISGLIDDPEVKHFKTNLRGKNYKIMDKIRECLPGS